jgi:hypothetical protein
MDLQVHVMRSARQPFQHLTTLSFGYFLADMHSILFAINKPDDSKPEFRAWHSIVSATDAELRTNKDTETLGQGAWLLKGASAFQVLGAAIASASRLDLGCRVLVIEKATDWSPAKIAFSQATS